LNQLLSSFWVNVVGAVVFAVVGVITLVVGSGLNDVVVQLAGWALIGISVILIFSRLRARSLRV
jgi:energy-converting hydrogenase Eha subunit E